MRYSSGGPLLQETVNTRTSQVEQDRYDCRGELAKVLELPAIPDVYVFRAPCISASNCLIAASMSTEQLYCTIG